MEEHVGGLCDSCGDPEVYAHRSVFGCVSMTVCEHSVCRCVGTYIYQYMQVCAPGGLPWEGGLGMVGDLMGSGC